MRSGVHEGAGARTAWMAALLLLAGVTSDCAPKTKYVPPAVAAPPAYRENAPAYPRENAPLAYPRRDRDRDHDRR